MTVQLKSNAEVMSQFKQNTDDDDDFLQSRTKKTSPFHIKIIFLDWTNPMKEWAEYTIEYLMDNRENDWKIPLIKNVIVVYDFWLVP